MKLLLLTDLPPSRDYTASIFLEKLVSFLPIDSVACFNVLNRYLNPVIPPELAWLPIRKMVKPLENSGVKRFGAVRSLVVETYNRLLVLPKIADEVIKYFQLVGANAILVPIQGQTMIYLAKLVAQKSHATLYPLVYDHPGWWIRENKIHPWIARQVLNDFGDVLRYGTKTSCCSWEMSKYYKALYGIQTVPVVAGLEKKFAQKPSINATSKTEFSICLTGQIYSSNEWGALIAALSMTKWKIAGKNIKIKLLAPQVNQYAKGQPLNIEFMGWRPQKEIIKICANSDLLYCPYWFDPEFEMEARLSFPSKLTNYLASGRPVFFHGPSYASPAKFLRKNHAALFCYSLNPKVIVEKLEEIMTNSELYRSLAFNGRFTFDHYLTTDCMRESFYQLLDIK